MAKLPATIERRRLIWSQFMAGDTYRILAKRHGMTMRGIKSVMTQMRKKAQIELFPETSNEQR